MMEYWKNGTMDEWDFQDPPFQHSIIPIFPKEDRWNPKFL
jgi:hypothetical protein